MATGIVCWFAFQMFENVGMVIGIMPVTGVPLPFVSYGGTSMFANWMAIGLLENVHLRRALRYPAESVVNFRCEITKIEHKLRTLPNGGDEGGSALGRGGRGRTLDEFPARSSRRSCHAGSGRAVSAVRGFTNA